MVTLVTNKRAKRKSKKVNSLTPLATIAYEAIKEDILKNRLRPGEPVFIDQYINDLNLSRTPLREAILRLEREGLVEIRPRMGTFVAHLNLQEIQDMYQVRRTLEGLAARLAAERIDSEELKAVETELLSCPTEGTIDYELLSERGQNLHRLIINSCGNRVLIRFIRSLQDHFARFRSLSLDIPEKILSSHHEHLQILEALKTRDGQLAEQHIHDHFDNASNYLLKNLLIPTRYGKDIEITLTKE
jgi:DNA-binding GntR family transcriptional regulator